MWSASRPGRLYPRERPGTYCTGGWVGPGACLDMCGKSRPTGIRSPDLPARSGSLYRLSYPGSNPTCTNFIYSLPKSRPTGIRSPDLPARSESLYRLRYPGSNPTPTNFIYLLPKIVPCLQPTSTWRTSGSSLKNFMAYIFWHIFPSPFPDNNKRNASH
jgi:hypothetical protein